jgi:hypothetical protein
MTRSGANEASPLSVQGPAGTGLGSRPKSLANTAGDAAKKLIHFGVNP